MGNCLAGDTCVFSHDPTNLMSKLTMDGASTPPSKGQGSIQFQDYNSFPSLQPGTPPHMTGLNMGYPGVGRTPPPGITPPSGLKPFHPGESPRPRSRPGSRHQSKEMTNAAPTLPALDDMDTFPSLGSASTKQGKKHHGKRGGHGHGHRENAGPSSLADIVRMSPSPAPAALRPDAKKVGRNGSALSMRNGENSAAAQAISNPKHIPWLETGDKANKAYLKARQEAIKHGGLRNKFLQR